MPDDDRPLHEHIPPIQAQRGGIRGIPFPSGWSADVDTENRLLFVVPEGLQPAPLPDSLTAAGGLCTVPAPIYDLRRPAWEHPDRPFGTDAEDLDLDQLVAPRLTAAIHRVAVLRSRLVEARQVLRGTHTAHPVEEDDDDDW